MRKQRWGHNHYRMECDAVQKVHAWIYGEERRKTKRNNECIGIDDGYKGNIRRTKMAEILMQSVLLSMVLEAAMQGLKGIFPNGALRWKYQLISLLGGIVICFSLRFEILSYFISVETPAVGYFLTGMIVGRGSNVVHKLVDTIQSLKKSS